MPTNKLTGKYKPLLCAYCEHFYGKKGRDRQGRKGYCPIIDQEVHHIDWCKEPAEQEQHRAAMAVYQDCGKH